MRLTALPRFAATVVTSMFIACPVLAQTPSSREESGSIRTAAEQYLRMQTAGLAGTVTITVGQVDPRLRLSACASLESFIPAGSKPWGRTTVGVRCTAPEVWTVYVQATVKVIGEYVAAQSPLAQGQMIGPADLTVVRGDLTSLPAGVVLTPSQAIGRTATVSIPSGAPLRSDALRAYPVVQQGQTVRLVTSGPGFQVSADGKALNTGVDGQVVQARTASGQLISGIAKPGGIVEVGH
jgi:flagellar basal body P-ring formation protein FlgA